MRAELSLPAIDTLWEDLGLDVVPFPLEIRGFGDTIGERARIKAGVYAELERRGLAGSGKPTPKLEDALHLLARPELSIDLVVQLDETIKAVTAARGRRALRAVQRERGIELTEVRDTAMVASIVELLPANRAGTGRSVTLPASVLRAGAGRSGAANRADLQVVASIMERPIVRMGQLGVIVRDERGVRRLPGIAWFDTDHGRYASTVRRGADGEDWTTLFPADNARLSHRLAELLVTGVRR
jgi:EspG family